MFDITVVNITQAIPVKNDICLLEIFRNAYTNKNGSDIIANTETPVIAKFNCISEFMGIYLLFLMFQI